MKKLALFLFALAFSACSITTPRDVGRANMITLGAPDIEARAQHKGVLRVDYPSVPDELDTYRIAVQKADGTRDYIAGARWSEFLPSLMQSALISTLNKSGSFTNVHSDEQVIASRYTLHTDIQEFQVVYGNAPAPQVSLRINFSVTESKNVIKTFVLTKKITAAANNFASIAQAFNEAFGGLAEDMVSRLATLK